MRAFIAVELPETMRKTLAALQAHLAQAKADVKWVEQGHLHVTMRFLGEITEEQRQAIEQLLSKIAASRPPIRAHLSQLGAFPSSGSPRVMWVGIGEGQEALGRIAGELESGLAALHLPTEDRAFVAHVTLGRTRSPKNLSQLATLLNETVWTPPEAFVITHLTFFQSTLSSSGPIYTILAKPPFSRGGSVPTAEAGPAHDRPSAP